MGIRVCRAVMLVALGLVAGGASASEYSWNRAVDGFFNDPSRWSPAGGPPGAADTATFSNPDEKAGYYVTFPTGADNEVGAVHVIGDAVFLDVGNGGFGTKGLTVNGTADDAVLLRADGASTSALGFGNLAVLRIPNGGLTLAGIPALGHNTLFGGVVSANRVVVSAGAAEPALFQVAHDVQLGNPGAPRGAAPVAFFTGTAGGASVGGVLRIHPDGEAGGRLDVAGGVQNAGLLDEGTQIFGGLVNAGELDAGDTGSGGLFHSSVTGNFVQTPDGILRIRGTLPRANTPLEMSFGTIDLGGTIVFTPMDAGAAKLNDRYPLIATTSPINYSATLVSGFEGMSFQPQLVPLEGLYAVVTAVPEPPVIALLLPTAVLLRGQLGHGRGRR